MKNNVKIHSIAWELKKSTTYASLVLFFVGSCFLISCDNIDDEVKEPWEIELDQLRAAVSNFTDTLYAVSQGYDNEFTGYRSQMGFHYLKESLLDDTFEVDKPEVVMYAPDANGDLKFVGVEYAVPILDMENPQPAPAGFTGNHDVWEINEEFGVWTLHVWVGMHNPHGIFVSHNPNLP